MSERRLAFLVRTQSNPGCYVTYRIHNMSHKLQDVVSATIRVLLRRERSIEAMPLGHLRYRIGKSAFPQEPSISDPVSPVLVSPRMSESACRFGSSNFGIAAIGPVVLSAIPRAAVRSSCSNHDYVFGTAGSGSPASPLLTRPDRKSAKGAISSSTLAFSRASM